MARRAPRIAKLLETQMSANLTIPKLRPVDYTQEIGSTICDRLFKGETLSEICRDAAMPDQPTVMRWLAQYPEFLDEYAFTCQLLKEDLAAEAISIVDNADPECPKRIRGAKMVTVSGRKHFERRRRLHLPIRYRSVYRLIRRKIVARALRNRKKVS
jgi:Bacteriophage Sf6, terminase small subunit-like